VDVVYWKSAENWKSVLRELNGTGWNAPVRVSDVALGSGPRRARSGPKPRRRAENNVLGKAIEASARAKRAARDRAERRRLEVVRAPFLKPSVRPISQGIGKRPLQLRMANMIESRLTSCGCGRAADPITKVGFPSGVEPESTKDFTNSTLFTTFGHQRWRPGPQTRPSVFLSLILARFAPWYGKPRNSRAGIGGGIKAVVTDATILCSLNHFDRYKGACEVEPLTCVRLVVWHRAFHQECLEDSSNFRSLHVELRDAVKGACVTRHLHRHKKKSKSMAEANVNDIS
jgi:hypothetical protein